MRHAPSPRILQRALPRADLGLVEWEELPSLAGSLARRGVAEAPAVPGTKRRSNAVALGPSTRPLDLDLELPDLAFGAAGASTRRAVTPRDIAAPGLLRHFFGV